MDELEKAIADLSRKIDRWTRQAEEGRIELAALQKAAKLRPSGANAVRRPPDAENDDYGPEIEDSTSASGADDAGKPGRRPGAISAEWRDVLLLLWMLGVPHTYTQIHDIAKGQKGLDIKDIASTRDRVRSFVANNLMTGTPLAGFTVTEEAAERFDFANRLKQQISAPSGVSPGGAGKVEGVDG